MALVSSNDILIPARDNGYAVGAFNTSNLEISQAIFEAASEMHSPVMIATSESAIKYAGFVNLFTMVKHLSEYYGVKAALHLDHGKDLSIAVRCLRHGWTSVMIDASSEEYEQNVSITSEVAGIAHTVGVSVEAELGRLAGVEDMVSVRERDASLTDPEQAAEFIERTGCDSLAVAIGTSHGAYKFKGEPELDLERLSLIARRVSIPLVLHGASSVPQDVLDRAARYGAKLPGAKGVPEDAIGEAVKRGVAKINIDTDLRLAFTGGVRELLAESPEVFDPRKILGGARKAIKDVVKRKIQLFGSEGKA
ncbi:MAG: class II fructose-1,6-bisphosphate aldolase [Candidatus Eisenbacteria bacterium]